MSDGNCGMGPIIGLVIELLTYIDFISIQLSLSWNLIMMRFMQFVFS